jgi:hypothetical protein
VAAVIVRATVVAVLAVVIVTTAGRVAALERLPAFALLAGQRRLFGERTTEVDGARLRRVERRRGRKWIAGRNRAAASDESRCEAHEDRDEVRAHVVLQPR